MSTAQPTGSTHPQKVAILGGGAAGAAAAFWLSAPEQKGRYQVTLYTQGWRLGGKCASGRNAELDNRIEEHGLHMLMGCYQNGFATLRACYGAWKPGPINPFQNWQDAFLPQRQVTLMEQDGPPSAPGGMPTWAPWNFPDFPKLPGLPGDPPSEAVVALESALSGLNDPTLILAMADFLDAWVRARLPPPFDAPLTAGLAVLREALRPRGGPDLIAEVAVDMLRGLVEANNALQSSLTTIAGPERPELAADAGWSIRRLLILANLGLAIGLGYARDIHFGGSGAYDRLDTQDFRAWLKTCEASDETLDSALVRAPYDLAFAYAAGNAGSLDNGSMAAGATLRFLLELVFGYRDAPLWRMAAGMGDTVFTPFYDVLTARGVSIQFFNRVTQLRPTTDGRIGQIDLMQQAKTLDGSLYRPLVNVLGLDCWPNQPDWSQLVDGQHLKAAKVNFESSYCTVSVGTRTLAVGTDFDIAIVAMPPLALKPVVAPLAAASVAWQGALDNSQSVATQSLQLWMQPTLVDLGWTLGSTVLTSFVEPYDSWADMSHLLCRETWSGPNAPQSLGYFCGCMQLPDGPVTPDQMNQLATQLADSWLTANIQTLWPDAVTAPGPDPQIASRYDLANFDISDQYVQTPAGNNVASRFDPGATADFSNLYVVGDWTKTRFSGGCFESAIESAMLASRGISGFPTEIKTS